MRRLRDAGRAAGLEDVDRLVGERLGHPAPHRAAAQPFVLERPNFFRSSKVLTSLSGSNFKLLGVVEPERAAGRRVKVPLHGLVRVGVELLARPA